MYAVTFIDNISYIIEIHESQKTELPNSRFGSIEDISRYISEFYNSSYNHNKRYYSINHVDNYIVFREVNINEINNLNMHIGHFDTIVRAIYNELAYIAESKS